MPSPPDLTLSSRREQATGREGRDAALRPAGTRPAPRTPRPSGAAVSRAHVSVTGPTAWGSLPSPGGRAAHSGDPAKGPKAPLQTSSNTSHPPRSLCSDVGLCVPGTPGALAREHRDLLPAPGRAHRTWAGSGTRSWTGCPPPPRPRAAGWSGPPWPLRPRRPRRLTAAARPAPDAGVGCRPRTAPPRCCGSGGGEPPARRAPSSAGPRGGACAEGGCGLGRGRRRRLRPGDVSGGSRAGTAAAKANGGAGRERPRRASQWAAGRGGAAAGLAGPTRGSRPSAG